MGKQTFEIRIKRSDKNGQYFWNMYSIVGGIEEIVASSLPDLFTRKENVKKSIESARRGFQRATIIDTTTD